MKTKIKKSSRGGKTLTSVVFKSQASMLITSVIVVAVLVGISALLIWTNGDYLETKVIQCAGAGCNINPAIPNQYFDCKTIRCDGSHSKETISCKTYINDGKCIYQGTAVQTKDCNHKIVKVALGRSERFQAAPGSCNPGYCYMLNHIPANPNYPFSSVDAQGWPVLTVPPLQCAAKPQSTVMRGSPLVIPTSQSGSTTVMKGQNNKVTPTLKPKTTPKATVKPKATQRPVDNTIITPRLVIPTSAPVQPWYSRFINLF